MATKLYLRDLTPADGDPGTNEQSSALPHSGAFFHDAAIAPKALSTTKGSSQVAYLLANTSSGGSDDDGFWTSFSGPSLAAQTISAQNWTVALAARDLGGFDANAYFLRAVLYVWRPGTSSVVGFIFDDQTVGANLDLTEEGRVATISGASVTTQAGDILVLEVWVHFVIGAAGDFDLDLYLNGTTDPSEGTSTSDAASYVQSTDDLTFGGGGSSGNSSNSQSVGRLGVFGPDMAVAVWFDREGDVGGWFADELLPSEADAPPIVKVVAETVQIAEATLRRLGLTRRRAETVEVAEASRRALVLVRRRAETVQLAEAKIRTMAVTRHRAETVEVSEASRRARGLVRRAAEVVQIPEAIAKARGFFKVVAETVQIAEAKLAAVGKVKVIAEAIQIAEAKIAALGKVKVIAESVSIAEATKRLRALVRRRAEDVQVSEATRRVRSLVRTVLESVSIVEAVRRAMALVRRRAETVEVSEAVTKTRGLVRVVSSVVSIVETFFKWVRGLDPPIAKSPRRAEITVASSTVAQLTGALETQALVTATGSTVVQITAARETQVVITTGSSSAPLTPPT